MATSETIEEISRKAPCINEQYGGSVGARNLRVEADRRTAADMVIAGGMSPHSTGLALMRLMTEWDASSKPIPMDVDAVERLASTYPIERPFLFPLAEPRNPVGGMVRTADTVWERVGEERISREVNIKFTLPLVMAKAEAERWHLHEMGLLLQRMKTLPTVRDALTQHARALGLEDGEHAVGAVLLWWLNPQCEACKGRKYRVVAGTGRTSSKLCTRCKGTGEKKVPHSYAGRKLLSYINECRAAARKGLAGKFGHHKPAA